jgi:putative endonuclease
MVNRIGEGKFLNSELIRTKRPSVRKRPTSLSYQRGQTGEKLAEEYLHSLGLKTILNNFRSPSGEIDIVMQDGDQIVFVEVKLRSSNDFGTPEQTLSESQIKRIAETALYYISEKIGKETDCRLDVVAISRDEGDVFKIVHYPDAVPLGEYLK